MATYDWVFGAVGSGLYFELAYDTNTEQFTVTSHEGSFDLNALWWSDGVADGSSPTLAKANSSLNMNGAVVVWDDDGGSTSQKIDWDGNVILSNPGLGTEGTNKSTFISSGETASFSVAGFDPTIASVLGVRATSVNGGGSIKYADEQAEFTPDPPPHNHFPDNSSISEATFYFQTDAGDTNADGWLVVKFVDPGTPTLSGDLDDWFDDAIGYIIDQNGTNPDSLQGVLIDNIWHDLDNNPVDTDVPPVPEPLDVDIAYTVVSADPFGVGGV